MGGKWIELLKEIVPSVRRVLFIHNPDNATWNGILRTMQLAADAMQMTVTGAGIRSSREIDAAIELFAGEPNGGLVVQPDRLTRLFRDSIAASAERHRLPAVYPFRYFVRSGGLVSYGVDVPDMYRRAAAYVDRILRGANPAELPVQNPVKYELVINVRAARTLGLQIPPTLLARADEVIE